MLRNLQLAAVALAAALPLAAQQLQPAPRTLAYVPTSDGVSVSGSLTVTGGRAAIGNNGTVAAVTHPALVTLARGGTLQVCSTTTVHLSSDASASTPEAQATQPLMLAFDRGALEAHYTAPPGSDVILTPDLRILVSGPGEVDLKLRVARSGDTCIDNHGDHAPYVTVSSLMEGGAYRVQPNQRVLFEHGSLGSVVDREADPCGCPPASPSELAPSSPEVASAHPGGPSSTPADTAFPLAVSEGLAQPPAPAPTPVVPAGTPHAQVTAVLSSTTPPGPPPAAPATAAAAPAPASPAPPQSAPNQQRGFFHSLGRFFTHLFNS